MASPPARQAIASCGIAVMAKASKAGRTKTRLSASVTGEDAARLNTAFLRDIADNLVHASAAESIAGYMAYGPPGEAAFFDFLPPSISLFEAWQPSFGETLKGTIQTLLDLGHRAACVLNADSPTLPTSILEDAGRILTEPGDHVVIGPSRDGGYYLLGMTTLHTRLFEDISWSTDVVMRQTMERAAEAGLQVRLLPEWYDVDDAASFEILRAELFGNQPFGSSRLIPSSAHHTRALMTELLAPASSNTPTTE